MCSLFANERKVVTQASEPACVFVAYIEIFTIALCIGAEQRSDDVHYTVTDVISLTENGL